MIIGIASTDLVPEKQRLETYYGTSIPTNTRSIWKLYQGRLFLRSIAYLRSVCQVVYILDPVHGLITTGSRVRPHKTFFNDMSYSSLANRVASVTSYLPIARRVATEPSYIELITTNRELAWVFSEHSLRLVVARYSESRDALLTWVDNELSEVEDTCCMCLGKGKVRDGLCSECRVYMKTLRPAISLTTIETESEEEEVTNERP